MSEPRQHEQDSCDLESGCECPCPECSNPETWMCQCANCRVCHGEEPRG